MQADGFARLMTTAGGEPDQRPKPEWTTPNHVRLDLTTLELRDFSTANDGVATLVCAPFALHSATIADFAPGHSLVQTLAHNGCRRIFVTDWRSATRDMRLLTIDNYLAELNVAVDEIGAPVDLVGLCQGGVMALIYAARFPSKVRKLVLAGAPVDLNAGASLLSVTARNLPLGLFDEVVRLGEGRVLGQRVIDLWGPALHGQEGAIALQIGARDDSEAVALLRALPRLVRLRPSICRAPTTIRPCCGCSRKTASPTAVSLRLAARSISARCASRFSFWPPGTTSLSPLNSSWPSDAWSAANQEYRKRPRTLRPSRLFVGSTSLAGGWSRAARWLTQRSRQLQSS